MSKCEVCGVELHGGLTTRCIKCQIVSWNYIVVEFKWEGKLLVDSKDIEMIKLCIKPITWE